MSIETRVKELNGTSQKKSYSVEEVMQILGVVRQTVYKLIERGWVKISISHWPTKRWSIWWRHHYLTPEQKRFLEPYFAPDSEFPVDDFERDYWEDEL